jgi:cytochrome c-type biogenesis protein
LLALAALGAGLVSFASPCVMPLVPAYLGFITGSSADELRAAHGRARLAVLRQGLAFVAGLAVIFALLGASASLIGEALLANLPVLWKVGGVVVVLFGLHMLGVLRIPWLYRSATLVDAPPTQPGSVLGAAALGLAFGAGWTPCVGPFLAGLLALASEQKTVAEGTALLLLYAFGLGIPFLLAGLAIDRALGWMRALRPYLGRVEQASGVLLVGMGLLLFTERFTLVTSWLTRAFGTGLAQ